jgi:hypothetical protein
MFANIIIGKKHRYVEIKAPPCGTSFLATRRLNGRLTMRKTILTLLGSALLVASVAQAASATERHHGRKVVRAPAPVTDQFRDSNASASVVEPGWSSGYYSHGFSAPAGH